MLDAVGVHFGPILFCSQAKGKAMENDRRKREGNGQERKDDATDSRTLDEIEEREKLPADSSNSPVPAPDEGSGRASDDEPDALI